jgi:hypothetical protein
VKPERQAVQNPAFGLVQEEQFYSQALVKILFVTSAKKRGV